MIQQFIFNFFCKESLALELVETQVLNPVALCGNYFNLRFKTKAMQLFGNPPRLP